MIGDARRALDKPYCYGEKKEFDKETGSRACAGCGFRVGCGDIVDKKKTSEEYIADEILL